MTTWLIVIGSIYVYLVISTLSARWVHRDVLASDKEDVCRYGQTLEGEARKWAWTMFVFWPFFWPMLGIVFGCLALEKPAKFIGRKVSNLILGVQS
jgi:hypothetical protein